METRTGMYPRLVVRHVCGNELNLTPKAFFEGNGRCNCHGKDVLQTIAAEMDKHSGFRFFGYDFSRETVNLLNEQSGAIKEAPLDKLGACLTQMDMPIRVPWTHEMFVRRVADLVNDEYEVVSHYEGHAKPVRIRYNLCGHDQMYTAHRFLHGERCSMCGEVYSPERLRTLIPLLSQGDYEFGGSEDNGLLRIKSRKYKADKILPVLYAVQELMRPTPSRVLPYGKKIGQHIQNEFFDSQTRRFEGLLLEHYSDRKFIFLDEFAMDQEDYQNAQYALKMLMAKTKAFRLVQKDVYVREGENYSMEEMLLERYCVRPNGILGFVSGENLAYEIGITKEQPKSLHLVSMLEEEQIIKAFRLVMERLEDMDEWKVTKAVLKELGYAPGKKKEKRTPVLSHEEMKAALLTG